MHSTCIPLPFITHTYKTTERFGITPSVSREGAKSSTIAGKKEDLPTDVMAMIPAPVQIFIDRFLKAGVAGEGVMEGGRMDCSDALVAHSMLSTFPSFNNLSVFQF